MATATRTVGYDLASRITGYTHAGAPTLDQGFGFDSLDRVTSWTANATSQGFGYDATGNRTSATIGATNYPYTVSPTSNRLNSIAGPTAQTYGYNAAGSITSATGRTYAYGARGRMDSVTVGATTTTYLYNAIGQRVRKTGGPAGTVLFAYDEAGRLLGDYNANGVATSEVVFLGDTPVAVLRTAETLVDNNTTATRTITGTWTTATADSGFHLTNYHQHAAGAGPDTFSFNPTVPATGSYRVYARWTANANRATDATYTVTHAGGTTPVVVNQRADGGEWVLLGTFNLAPGAGHKVSLQQSATGIVVADAIKLVNTAATTTAATVFYIYTDQIDTPRVVTNNANQLRWRWLADPFGTAAAEQNPASLGTFAFHWRFPGQYWDQETGSHYNYFRDYEPGTGRYVQSDPIGLAGGINTYAYVASDPLIYADPLGLWRSPSGIYDDAMRDATRSGLPGPHNGLQDAYRHCLASCEMTRENSEKVAQCLGWANEKRGDWWRNQEKGERSMDDFNNSVGFRFGRTSQSYQACQNACMRAARAGQLRTHTPGTSPGYWY